MAVAKKKYYVVWVGKNPGVYDNWMQCKEQISGFPNARYKAFASREEAGRAFRETFDAHYGKGKPKPATTHHEFTHEIVSDSICVDAACSGNPGLMEYRGVHTSSGEEIFRIGPLEDGTNNIGEFLAIVHALAMFEKQGKKEQLIYTDSRVAIKWIIARKAKTKLERNTRNTAVFALLERAENWLQSHSWDHRILKWKTEHWGEIPADFGRK